MHSRNESRLYPEMRLTRNLGVSWLKEGNTAPVGADARLPLQAI